jgi:hypothetical protein
VSKIKPYEASGTLGRVSADLVAVVTSGGIVMTVSGGDLPHVGAVALAEPRPSRADRRKTSSSVSVMVRLGHKEDELAKRLAGRAASSLKVPVVLAAGIHIDHPSAEDIKDAELLADALVTDSIPKLSVLLEAALPRRRRRPRSPS